MTSEYIALLVICFLAGFITNSFLPAYFRKKGENLATKEDIAIITNKIESVKHDYAEQLEATKASLSAQLNKHGFRYEKEYQVLSKLTALLVEVRDASLNLRPSMDIRDSNKPEEEIKVERLLRFNKAGRALYLYRENKRPFYPNEIYEVIQSIENTAYSESIAYHYKDPSAPRNVITYWDEAQKNQATITEISESAMAIIRARVTVWEALSHGT
jgi:hypothetical protein